RLRANGSAKKPALQKVANSASANATFSYIRLAIKNNSKRKKLKPNYLSHNQKSKMMKPLKIAIILATTILFASCLKKEEAPKPIVDYGGITDYYIVNKSKLNLNITYKIAPTPIYADSTVMLPA